MFCGGKRFFQLITTNTQIHITFELCPFLQFTKTDWTLADTHATAETLVAHKNENEEQVAVVSMSSNVHCKWTKLHSNYKITIFVAGELLTKKCSGLARSISCTRWISDCTELKMQTIVLHSPSIFTVHTESIRRVGFVVITEYIEWIAEIGISLCVYYDDNALLNLYLDCWLQRVRYS